MSLLQQILDGSLISRQRLMEARHHYAPHGGAAAADAGFARWTERVALQPELGSARELAGLPDAELSALEAEFARFPVRRRCDRFRHAFRVGALLFAVGGVGLALQALVGGTGFRALQVFSIACVLAAVCAAAVGAYVAFSMLHLDLSHGTLGLYVGKLDAQHPWLYESVKAVRNPTAEAYRQQVLRERGPLRGMDYVIMREIVRSQEMLERTQWAHTMAEHLQRAVPLAEAGASEPRLVRVGARG